MGSEKLKIDPESGLAYFSKRLRAEGFVGEVEGIPNALTFTLICPGADPRDVEESLEIVLRDLRLRRRHKEAGG